MPSGSSRSDSTPSKEPRRLVVATLNRAKGAELALLLGDLPVTVTPLADVAGAWLPDETGETYADNARLKARAGAAQTGLPTIADDSGLEVDALDGAPGVRSARYGGPGLDDAARVRLLLEALADVPEARRTARFRCVIALVEPSGAERVVKGSVDGVILRAPRGTGGFGYDPVFFYAPLGRTFAELTRDEKSRVDHRGAAVRALRQLLYC